MTAFLTLIFCIMSFVCLAMAMERHQMTIHGRAYAAGRTRGLRIAGWCGLVLALRFIVDDRGWALGLVDYSGCTSLAAGIVIGGLIAFERFRRAGE